MFDEVVFLIIIYNGINVQFSKHNIQCSFFWIISIVLGCFDAK